MSGANLHRLKKKTHNKSHVYRFLVVTNRALSAHTCFTACYPVVFQKKEEKKNILREIGQTRNEK